MYTMKSERAKIPALAFPEHYIDVKTGEKHPTSPKIVEQIEYHTRNRTIEHLILSALHEYLEPRRVNGNIDDLMRELSEIKRFLTRGVRFPVPAEYVPRKGSQTVDLDLQQVDDILEAFGG